MREKSHVIQVEVKQEILPTEGGFKGAAASIDHIVRQAGLHVLRKPSQWAAIHLATQAALNEGSTAARQLPSRRVIRAFCNQ